MLKIFLASTILVGSLFAGQSGPSLKIKKKGHIENDVISSEIKYDVLKNPEVKLLLNKSYKKGFSDGAEESKAVMKAKLKKMERFMDELFAFHKLYLEGKLEPPKVGVVNQPIQVTKEGKVMVIQQEYLEIIEPAKFVNKPKTWENFIY